MTKIQWTEKSWNPVTGCTRVSPGCDHCYAFALHDKRHKANRDAARAAWEALDGPDRPESFPTIEWARSAGYELPCPPQYDVPFSRVQLLPERLEVPLRTRKPTMFFPSMCDPFHEDVPDEYLDRVFAAMALSPRHTFQLLTKRPERAREYLTLPDIDVLVDGCAIDMVMAKAVPGSLPPDVPPPWPGWPLPNVWIGTSVEDQQRADERIPHLLDTPAAVRFLSCEPLLGPLDLRQDLLVGPCPIHDGPGRFCGRADTWNGRCPDKPAIHWVIVGGESGKGARPCDINWIRSIVEQCQAAGTAVFVKQLGSRACVMPDISGRAFREWTMYDRSDGTHWDRRSDGTRIGLPVKLRHSHGGDPDEWPEDLRVREWPAGVRRDAG